MRKPSVITQFVESNRIISILAFVSVIIILSYILTMDCPELFPGAERWFNLMFQLSIGFFTSFVFYITQIFIPEYKAKVIINKNVKKRVGKIINDMDRSLSALVNKYSSNKGKDNGKYTNQALNEAKCKLRFNDDSNIVDASLTTVEMLSNPVYIKVGQWIKQCIYYTERDIDMLFRHYAPYLSPNLTDTLESILNSVYHTQVSEFISYASEVSFGKMEPDFLVEYSNLMEKLKEIQTSEYSLY